MKAGFIAIIPGGWTKTLIFIVLAPLIGMVMGFIIMVLIQWLFQGSSPAKVDHWFRRMQLCSAAAYSLGHGGNDAQKTMGIIAGALVAGGYLNLVDGKLPIPFWVIMAAHAAIALGTLSGGWRIIHTMGSKITKLQPVGGFAAETAGAISLFAATHLGVPVSTTHTITGAIIGVGSIRRLSAVRWGVAGRIVWAWILTIPASAFVAAVVYYIVARTVAP
jgi:PiT family inorganic phosphate transporter